MDDINSKKRKRDGDSSGKIKKKVVFGAPASKAKVTTVLQAKSCPPVIATTPGVNVSNDVTFQPYIQRDRSRSHSGKSNKSGSELLLHSTAHRTLDYTAREDVPQTSSQLLRHYIGVYDPQTGKLEVVEAKKMVVRGVVRAKQADASSMGDNSAPMSVMDRRADLGQTFGTKKAKKALRENALNAIAPQKKDGESPTKLDSAAKAMVDSVGQITTNMATREELQAAVDEAKPVPKANMEAEDVQEVYEPEAIIGGDILNLVPIREWQEKVRHNEGIEIASRFVAARVNSIAANDDEIMRLRVLRYFGFLLLFYLKSKPGRQRGTRQVLPREQLREALSPAPEAVVENIRRKFSDKGVIRKFHIDLIFTHLCAFALIVDNFETDTQNLRDDMRVDQHTINQYFHEIGVKVKPYSNKAEGRVVHVARMQLPLEFPKQRQMARRR